MKCWPFGSGIFNEAHVLKANLKPMAIVISLCVASCGGSSKPPNMTVSGVVQKITKNRPACYKIEFMLGGCGSDYYSLDILSDSAEKWYGTVSESRVDENDLRQVIGKRITFTCYRAAEEKAARCSQRWDSLNWNGRELMSAAKP
jgi:hypothetical protein